MNFIFRLNETVRSAWATRRGATAHADQVPTGLCKEYPRMPRIQLPLPEPFSMPLHVAMSKRRSIERAQPGRPFTGEELGTLLGHSISADPESVHRKYPSGGGNFPIETYLIGSIIDSTPPGVFHYHPKNHTLEHLWDLPADLGMDDIIRAKDAPLSGALMIFTACWNRSGMKYGDFGYYLGMLEAGHMAQNVLLAATALNIGTRPIGGFDDALVSRLLDLDAQSEQPLYAIVLAVPPHESKAL